MTRLANIATPALVLYNVLVNRDVEQPSFWTVQAWAALATWFRFLLYLRSLDMFSWLIRMIVECIADMMVFLTVLLIGVFAFADAFQSIEQILVIEGFLDAKPFDNEADLFEKYFTNYFSAW